MTEDKTASTTEGTESNTPVSDPDDRDQQTPDQFFDPERERAKADEHVPASHATKGMTVLGYTEASRIEDTAATQERERDQAARAAARAEKGKG